MHPNDLIFARPAAAMMVACAALLLGACATKPLLPYSADTPPLVLVPASQAGVRDMRGHFREIYCAVLEAHGTALPDYRPCDDALTRVGAEPPGTGKPVDLKPSQRHLLAAVVSGIGYDCFRPWLNTQGTVVANLRQSGYDGMLIDVDARKHLATAVGDFRVRVDDDGSNGEFAGDPVRDLQSWTGCIWISPDCPRYVAPTGGPADLRNLSATFHGNSSSMRLTL
jgi:hypothetical protein